MVIAFALSGASPAAKPVLLADAARVAAQNVPAEPSGKAASTDSDPAPDTDERSQKEPLDIAEPPRTVRLLASCGDVASCTKAHVNLGPAGKIVTYHDSERFESQNRWIGDWTEYVIAARARLPDDDRWFPVHVQHSAKTDGLFCDDCGYGRGAALLGFTSEEEAIVRTDAGPLVMSPDFVQIGCRDCIRVLDGENVDDARAYHAPTWDASNFKPERLSTDDERRLYVLQGATCIRLHRDRLFEVVAPERCRPVLNSERTGYAKHLGFPEAHGAAEVYMQTYESTQLRVVFIGGNCI